MGLFKWLGEMFDAVTAPSPRQQLMTVAAGISSVRMRCHADTWREITDKMWTSAPKVPAERITELGDEMVEVVLSGPNLVTLVQVTSPDARHVTYFHQALAARVHQALSKVLAAVDPDTSSGAPIPPIVLDDRIRDDITE